MKSANLQLLYGMKNLNSKTPEELDYYSEKFYEICHKTISLYQDYHKINKKAVGWRNQEIVVLEKKETFCHCRKCELSKQGKNCFEYVPKLANVNAQIYQTQTGKDSQLQKRNKIRADESFVRSIAYPLNKRPPTIAAFFKTKSSSKTKYKWDKNYIEDSFTLANILQNFLNNNMELAQRWNKNLELLQQLLESLMNKEKPKTIDSIQSYLLPYKMSLRI